jgi:hypothetical protein
VRATWPWHDGGPPVADWRRTRPWRGGQALAARQHGDGARWRSSGRLGRCVAGRSSGRPWLMLAWAARQSFSRSTLREKLTLVMGIDCL